VKGVGGVSVIDHIIPLLRFTTKETQTRTQQNLHTAEDTQRMTNKLLKKMKDRATPNKQGTDFKVTHHTTQHHTTRHSTHATAHTPQHTRHSTHAIAHTTAHTPQHTRHSTHHSTRHSTKTQYRKRKPNWGTSRYLVLQQRLLFNQKVSIPSIPSILPFLLPPWSYLPSHLPNFPLFY
jgi:hypothetical protein